MKFSQYYQSKMTEALDKKEGEMWRDFYTTILPRRIKKFKKKYTGTPESLEKAVQEYEDKLVGNQHQTVCDRRDEDLPNKANTLKKTVR